MTTPTDIRLAIESRRADVTDELHNIAVAAHDMIERAYQDEAAAHIETIKLLARVEARQDAPEATKVGRAIRRLEVSMPPRHGKTTTFRLAIKEAADERKAWQEATACEDPAEAKAKRERWTAVSRGNLSTIGELQARAEKAEREVARLEARPVLTETMLLGAFSSVSVQAASTAWTPYGWPTRMAAATFARITNSGPAVLPAMNPTDAIRSWQEATKCSTPDRAREIIAAINREHDEALARAETAEQKAADLLAIGTRNAKEFTTLLERAKAEHEAHRNTTEAMQEARARAETAEAEVARLTGAHGRAEAKAPAPPAGPRYCEWRRGRGNGCCQCRRDADGGCS